VFSGEPDELAELEYNAITGQSADDVDRVNRKEVHWGLLEEQVAHLKGDAAEEKEKEKIPIVKDESQMDIDKDTEKEEEKEGSKKSRETPSKRVKTEAIEPASPPIETIKSMIPIPPENETLEVKRLEDLRRRVALSSTSLPSICFFTFLNAHNSINCVDIARDASVVAGGFSDSSIKVWDLQKDHQRIFGKEKEVSTARKRTTDYVRLLGHSGPVYSCSFSPDNQYLISASEDNTARLWSLETRTNLVCYRGHNYPVWDVEFSPLGYYFATASHDRTARLWSTDHIYPLRIFAGHLSDVDCVKFHPNCNYVATGSSDKSIRLWEVNSGNCARIFTGHYGSIYALAFSPDGRLLASAGEDKNVMIWDLGTGKRVKTFSGHHEKCIWSLDFSAEGTLLASGSADSSVRLWAMDRSAATAPSPGLATAIASVTGGAPPGPPVPPSPTFSSALTSEDASKTGKKRTITKSPELLKTFGTKKTPIYSLKFTHRNLLLAAGPFQATE